MYLLFLINRLGEHWSYKNRSYRVTAHTYLKIQSYSNILTLVLTSLVVVRLWCRLPFHFLFLYVLYVTILLNMLQKKMEKFCERFDDEQTRLTQLSFSWSNTKTLLLPPPTQCCISATNWYILSSPQRYWKVKVVTVQLKHLLSTCHRALLPSTILSSWIYFIVIETLSSYMDDSLTTNWLTVISGAFPWAIICFGWTAPNTSSWNTEGQPESPMVWTYPFFPSSRWKSVCGYPSCHEAACARSCTSPRRRASRGFLQ